MTYEDKKAQLWLWCQAFLEKHYGPKYPCMFVFSFLPTNLTLTESTDYVVKTLYLPDRIRRMALTIRKYVLRLYGKRRIEDSTLKRYEDRKSLELVTELAQHSCDVHVFAFVFRGLTPRLRRWK